MKLKITKLGNHIVPECFGWTEDMHDSVLRGMVDWAIENEPESQTHMLKEYMESDAWDKLGIKLVTANDFFMMGMLFATVGFNIQRLTKGTVVGIDMKTGEKSEINLED